MDVGAGADVVIVGAGVIGSSIALELARGGRSVTVVDKASGPGQGSTAASSAVVRFNFSSAAGVALAWEAHFGWRDWGAHLSADVGDLARYVTTGLVMLDVDAAPRKTWLPLFDTFGVPYQEWDSADLVQRVSGLDSGRYGPPKSIDDPAFWDDATSRLGGVFTPDAGYVSDPALAAVNLAAAAQAHGATMRFRSQVTAVEQRGGKVSAVVLSDGSRIGCDIVVNAAGPWSGALNQIAGVGSDFTVGVRPMRQEVAHVAAPDDFRLDGGPGPAIADLDLGTYFRGELGGGLLVGGTEPDCDDLEWVEPDAVDAVCVRPTMAVFERQVLRAARRLPGLVVPNRPSGVVGVYDVADDWSPIYDRTDLPGFYVAIGTSGNQFKNAPTVGQLMATLIDEVEAGADHDTSPITFVTPRAGLKIDLGAYSRRRSRANTTGTVMG